MLTTHNSGTDYAHSIADSWRLLRVINLFRCHDTMLKTILIEVPLCVAVLMREVGS